MGLVLPMLIHALQPERHPAATRFEVRDFEFGKFFQDSVSAKVKTGEHLLERMTGDVPAEFAVAIRSGLREDGPGAFMDADRNAEIGSGGVNRIVFRAGQCTAAKFVWAPENAYQSELFASIFHLFDGTHGILQRYQHDAVEALTIVIAVFR